MCSCFSKQLRNVQRAGFNPFARRSQRGVIHHSDFRGLRGGVEFVSFASVRPFVRLPEHLSLTPECGVISLQGIRCSNRWRLLGRHNRLSVRGKFWVDPLKPRSTGLARGRLDRSTGTAPGNMFRLGLPAL